MASTYYDSAGKNVNDGDTAFAADLNDINAAINTGFELVEAAIVALGSNLDFYSNLAEQWAENPEDVAVTPGKYSALHHSAKAEDQAVIATTQAGIATTQAGFALNSRNDAFLFKSQAGASALAASESEVAAELAETNAELAETNAEAAEANAITQVGLATTQATNASNSAIAAAASQEQMEPTAYFTYSITSNTIAASGAKTFTVEAGKSYVAGDIVKVYSYVDTDQWMGGSVTSYSGTTLIVQMTAAQGSGTKTNWRVSGSSSSKNCVIAATQALAAAASASTATTQAGIATTQAGIATTQAGIATTQAGIATTQATNASNSALAADGSADAAAISESNADTSANAAAASAIEADGYADDAAASAASVTTSADTIEMLRAELIKHMIPAQAQQLIASAFIVDVFTYDTTKDSDGGMWRMRCQDKSWYNEPLNTATRGATREFPAVAVIVAELNKITILDATVAGCPMWLVYLGATNNHLLSNTYPSTGVCMMNGVLVSGHNAGGVFRSDFLKDSSMYYQADFIPCNGPIALRNSAPAFTPISGTPDIPSLVVNDVAITVIPTASVSSVTGLPIPTIGVAHDAGLSIIDGPAGVDTIVDQTWYVAGDVKSNGVSFPEDGGVAWRSRTGSAAYAVYVHFENSIPNADKATEPSVTLSSSIAASATIDLLFAGGTSYAYTVLENAIGHTTGLTLLERNTLVNKDSLLSYITKDYNTTWVTGNCQRALICDALGEGNLVVNGTFDTDVSGWLTYQSTIAWVAGKIRITNTSTDGRAYRVFTTVIGQTYRITGTSFTGTESTRVMGPGLSGTVSMSGAVSMASSGVEYSTTFVATGTSTAIVLQITGSNGNYADFDNVSVQKLDMLQNLVTTWANYGGAYVYETMTISGANITSAINTTSSAAIISNDMGLVVGKRYIVNINITLNSGAAPALTIGNNTNGFSGDTIGSQQLVAGLNTYTWTCALSTHRYAWLLQLSDTVGNWSAIVTIQEAVIDRCSKNSTFAVNGTIIRSPVAVGSELQNIGPFSTTGYLSQAYSSDLDFGTSDFHFAGWMQLTANSTNEVVFNRGYWNGSAWTGSAILIQVLGTGVLQIVITNNAYSNTFSSASVSAVDTSTPVHFVIQRVGGNIQIWINGVKERDVTITTVTGSLSQANATLNIGLNQDLSSQANHMRLSLLRIGTGSLAASVITKMYKDEIQLFNINSLCTLQATSNQVNALSYDPRYNDLYVGTQDVMTKFRGLVADPVTSIAAPIKSVSAVDGIVVASNSTEAYLRKL